LATPQQRSARYLGCQGGSTPQIAKKRVIFHRKTGPF